MIGNKLGQYEIESSLGSGGMGEVYQARDIRLGRSVAVKVLPEAFAKDPERIARFEREAKVLAALNHSNIAALHGFEQSGEHTSSSWSSSKVKRWQHGFREDPSQPRKAWLSRTRLPRHLKPRTKKV